jgi:hypothetical protein
MPWYAAPIAEWVKSLPADADDNLIKASLADFVSREVAKFEADEDMERFADCGWFRLADELEDGLCLDCWHDKYFECEHCHERHDMADLVIYERGGDQWNLCKECASDRHYVVCKCGDYATERKGDFTKPQEFICDRCKNSF